MSENNPLEDLMKALDKQIKEQGETLLTEQINAHEDSLPLDKVCVANRFYSPQCFSGVKCGDFVSIRPCKDEKTYLGIYLGDFASEIFTGYSIKHKSLDVWTNSNPAIFVPDLKKVVFGFESWWGRIKSENDLRQITDVDIENIWYVRALKILQDKNLGKVS